MTTKGDGVLKHVAAGLGLSAGVEVRVREWKQRDVAEVAITVPLGRLVDVLSILAGEQGADVESA